MAQLRTEIKVKLQPRASSSQILGFRGDVLQARVTPPPVKGKANEALLELLAKALGVSKSGIKVIRGHTIRHKLIAVDGLSQDDLLSRLKGELPR